MLPEGAHIEIARGSIQDNEEYCEKEGRFEVYGSPPAERGQAGGDATKRKWEEAYESAKEGAFDEIPAELYIKYRTSFKAIFQEEVNKNPKEIGDWDLKKHFIWIWGPTGTGKSYMARSLAQTIDPDNPPYLKPLNKWWNGYTMQKVVIIEEANPDACKCLTQYFKLWCDRWRFAAETKGGSFDHGIRPDYIIITSNYDIAACFPNEADREPMLRRCYEFYKETRQSWLPWNFNDNEEQTQVIPPSQTVALQGLGDTQIDISEDSPSYDEALLKIATNLNK